MNNKGSIAEFILLNVIAAAICIAGLFTGFVMLTCFSFLPACIAYSRLRFSTKNAVVTSFIIAIAAFVCGGVEGMLSIAPSVITGFLLAGCMSGRVRLVKTILYCIAGYITGLAVYVFGLSLYADVSVAELADQFFKPIELSGEMLASVMGAEAINKVDYYNTVLSVLPAFAVITFSVLAYIMISCVNGVLKRRYPEKALLYVPFVLFHAEKSTAVLGILSYIFIMIFSNMGETGRLIGIAFLNMSIVLSALILVCGWSLLFYYAKISSGSAKAINIALAIFMIIFMPYACMLIGFADAFINFRRFRGVSK